jgi:magnesium chelatase subunit I
VARDSHAISQKSGVSVRLSIANYETVVASALRRALRTGDATITPRISDLAAMVQSTQGKLEFDTLDDADADQIIAALVSLAVRQCFMDLVILDNAGAILEAFDGEAIVHVGDDLPDADYRALLATMPDLAAAARALFVAEPTDGELASAAEFILEGLYLTKRLAKDASGPRALYRTRNR